jgi:branched-chain amino acid transport system permease protein
MKAVLMKYRPFVLLLLLAAAIAYPWASPLVALVVPGLSVMSIAVFTVIYAGATTAWNIFSGYTGYIALGHAVFFGTGAYALAIICKHWHVTSDYGPMLLLPICGLIAAAVAVPLGAIALRARSHTFVVITIAMFFIFQLLAYNFHDLTQGSAGLELPIPSWEGPSFDLPFYYVGLIILLLALAASWWVRSSKYGLGLLAIRDDEERALGLGVKTGPSKLVAFVISAFFVGMLGGLWAYYIESVFPNSGFNALFDVSIALMAFLGGIGTLAGPILGAVILIPTQQYFASDPNLTTWQLVLYGAVFLVVILLLPEGIIPTVRKRWQQWTARGAQSPPLSGSPTTVDPTGPAPPVVAASGERGGR